MTARRQRAGFLGLDQVVIEDQNPSQFDTVDGCAGTIDRQTATTQYKTAGGFAPHIGTVWKLPPNITGGRAPGKEELLIDRPLIQQAVARGLFFMSPVRRRSFVVSNPLEPAAALLAEAGRVLRFESPLAAEVAR